MAQLEPIGLEAEAQSYQFTEEDVKRQLSNLAKVAIVVQDMQLSEAYANERGLHTKLDREEQLYYFQVPQHYWEGTQLKRSSLGVPLVLEHVIALNATVQDIMFEEDPPFVALPHYGTDPLEARAATEVLAWECEEAGVETNMDLGSQYCLLHGTNYWKAFWTFKNGHILPSLESVDRKYVYPDPTLEYADARRAKYVIHRMIKTVEEVDQMRYMPGFHDIPSLEELKMLAIPPQEQIQRASQEQNKSFLGTMDIAGEFVQRDREQPASIDPSKWPLEVLEHTSHTVVYTVLQRKVLIRDEDNQHGFVRWYSAPYIPALGKQDGIGIAGLIGNEQRLQQGLTNGLLDHFSLSLMGMFTVRQGSTVFPQAVRTSPGKVFRVLDKDDISRVDMGSIDPRLFDTIDMSDSRAIRRTGANEVSVQGSFPQSSGGLGRTAAGINLLAQGSSVRSRKFVKALESQVLMPFLQFLIETNPSFLDKGLLKNVLSKELSKAFDLKPERILEVSAQLKFRLLGSTKMKRRSAMLQSVPFLFETYQQPAVQEALESNFQKVDFNELNWMLFDATGWPNKQKLIVDMTEEEKMQVMSKNPLMQQMALQREQIRMQSEAKIDQIDADNAGLGMRDILKSALEKGALGDQSKMQLMEMLGGMKANQDMDQQMSEMQTEQTEDMQ